MPTTPMNWDVTDVQVRNDHAVRAWKRSTWPALKKKLSEEAA